MTTDQTDQCEVWLKGTDVCSKLRISRRTLRNYVTTKKLRAYRLPGRHLRFRQPDVDKIVTEC